MGVESFDDLIGNGVSLSLIQRSLSNGTFPKVTSFSGVYGTGKSTTAKLVAMALTCENPVNGKPCCQCISCRSNLAAFRTTGESASVKIINMGTLNKKDDVNQLIHDVFVLQSGTGNKVYVFEEAHALKDVRGAQTALLEEIDRIPSNTFIIMCTTKVTDLLSELRSRAVNFTFNRLTNSEAALLVEKHSLKEYGKRLPVSVSKIIISQSRGIPRDLLKLVDFIMQNKVTEDELKEYLQVISDSTFIAVFNSMKSMDVNTYYSTVESLFRTKDANVILQSLKEFILNCLFLVEGGVCDTFTKSEKDDVKELFDSKTLMKVAQRLDTISVTSEENLKLIFLRIRLIMQERTQVDVFKDKCSIGSIEKEKTRVLNAELNEIQSSTQEVSLKKLSLSSLDGFK